MAQGVAIWKIQKNGAQYQENNVLGINNKLVMSFILKGLWNGVAGGVSKVGSLFQTTPTPPWFAKFKLEMDSSLIDCSTFIAQASWDVGQAGRNAPLQISDAVHQNWISHEQTCFRLWKSIEEKRADLSLRRESLNRARFRSAKEFPYFVNNVLTPYQKTVVSQIREFLQTLERLSAKVVALRETAQSVVHARELAERRRANEEHRLKEVERTREEKAESSAREKAARAERAERLARAQMAERAKWAEASAREEAARAERAAQRERAARSETAEKERAARAQHADPNDEEAIRRGLRISLDGQSSDQIADFVLQKYPILADLPGPSNMKKKLLMHLHVDRNFEAPPQQRIHKDELFKLLKGRLEIQQP